MKAQVTIEFLGPTPEGVTLSPVTMTFDNLEWQQTRSVRSEGDVGADNICRFKIGPTTTIFTGTQAAEKPYVEVDGTGIEPATFGV